MFHLDYYFIDEAARILGIRPRSVYVLIKKGKLETRKKHDMTVIPESSLKALIESGYKPKRKRGGGLMLLFILWFVFIIYFCCLNALFYGTIANLALFLYVVWHEVREKEETCKN